MQPKSEKDEKFEKEIRFNAKPKTFEFSIVSLKEYISTFLQKERAGEVVSKEELVWGDRTSERLFNLGLPIGKKLIYDYTDAKRNKNTMEVLFRYDYEEKARVGEAKGAHLNLEVKHSNLKAVTKAYEGMGLGNKGLSYIAVDSKQEELLYSLSKNSEGKIARSVLERRLALFSDYLKDNYNKIKSCAQAAIQDTPFKEKKDLTFTSDELVSLSDTPEILEKYWNLLLKENALPKDLMFIFCGINKQSPTSSGIVQALSCNDNRMVLSNETSNKKIFDEYLHLGMKLKPEELKAYEDYIINPLICAASLNLSIEFSEPQVESTLKP